MPVVGVFGRLHQQPFAERLRFRRTGPRRDQQVAPAVARHPVLRVAEGHTLLFVGRGCRRAEP